MKLGFFCDSLTEFCHGWFTFSGDPYHHLHPLTPDLYPEHRIIGGRVYPSEVRPKEKKVKQGKGGEAKPKNKEAGEQR